MERCAIEGCTEQARPYLRINGKGYCPNHIDVVADQAEAEAKAERDAQRAARRRKFGVDQEDLKELRARGGKPLPEPPSTPARETEAVAKEKKKCSEAGCEKPVFARDLCTTHYYRAKRAGNASASKPAVKKANPRRRARRTGRTDRSSADASPTAPATAPDAIREAVAALDRGLLVVFSVDSRHFVLREVTVQDAGT